jgi:AcrR family transcriptional regulator
MSSKRQANAAASRQILKDAALALIAERGLAGFTISDVASRAGTSQGRAGMSRGLAGYHFQSKDGLIEEVVGDLLAHRPAAGADVEGDALTQLAVTIELLLLNAAQDEVRTRALYAVLGAVQ